MKTQISLQSKSDIKSFLNLWWFCGLLAMIIISTGCPQDEDINPQLTYPSTTKQFSTSSDDGKLSINGFSLEVMPGSIPSLANGDEATVTFSIETGLELPKVLPENMQLIGEVAHFGPEGFVFKNPIWVTLPVPEPYSPDNVAIIFYDDESHDFKIIPVTNIDHDNKTVGVSVLQLDYFALARVDGITRSSTTSGAIKWNTSSDDHCYPPLPSGWNSSVSYVHISVKNYTPKFEWQREDYYPPNKWVASTPSVIEGGYAWHSKGIELWCPQGNYEFWVTVTRRVGGVISGQIEAKTYSKPATCNVDKAASCWWGLCNDYSYMDCPSGGGQWIDGWPTHWPNATIPVCTGNFQVTLTWFNGSGPNGDTDLDLHLYGPDNLHVYFDNSNPGIGGILLDRDIISTAGDVQENICALQLSNMPRGDYRVAVNHYDGLAKNFQVRLIRGNQSNNFAGTLNPGNPELTITTFTLN